MHDCQHFIQAIITYFCAMVFKRMAILYMLILNVLIFSNTAFSQTDTSQAHAFVVMRMIGHEVLKSTGDDTSMILPILKEGNRFKIQFENDFDLVPYELASAVQTVVSETKFAEKYRVEVEFCENKMIAYAFEAGISDSVDQLVCVGRLQPKSCYIIYFTTIDTVNPSFLNEMSSLPVIKKSTKIGTYLPVLIILMVLLLGMLLLFVKRKKRVNQAHIINLGKYQFDQRKMLLILKSSKVELTSKEADLLGLLYESANKTLAREVILNNVWGDEGDYVGRTLDVFISKLRKKLIADESVKIVNVRGVGYKLVVDL